MTHACLWTRGQGGRRITVGYCSNPLSEAQAALPLLVLTASIRRPQVDAEAPAITEPYRDTFPLHTHAHDTV